MGVCVCLLFIISQWSWWLYWERWPSRQGPADHWPAGRTSSSQHWWLTGDKKKSIGNKRKSESTFFCHNQATIHPLNYKQIHIQRHIEVCFQPFLVSVSGHIHCHRFLWKWKTTEPRDSPTHTQQHFLCMAMMTQLDSAVSVCHHLPTSNHDGGGGTNNQIFSHGFTAMNMRKLHFNHEEIFGSNAD